MSWNSKLEALEANCGKEIFNMTFYIAFEWSTDGGRSWSLRTGVSVPENYRNNIEGYLRQHYGSGTLFRKIRITG